MVDKAVLERILNDLDISLGRLKVYGGCHGLDAEIPKFLQMTRSHAVCILRDLDSEVCAPSLLKRLGADKAADPSNLVFRVPVRQIEAWLLADAESFSRHFKISKAMIPACPDDLDDAKEGVLRLIRRSNSPTMKEAMLPREGYSNRTGPEYASALKDFVIKVWSPDRARARSPSLDRSLKAFQAFKAANRR